jgi:Flp pilus assembly pilin Flp
MLTDIKRYATTLRERGVRGQTMTEYALILAAVAVVVYAGYQTMGTKITGLLTSVDSNL